MICPCGGQCREYEVIAGWVQKCKACGRREVFPRREGGEVDQGGCIRSLDERHGDEDGQPA
jgi:hypothetical protein